MHCGWALLLLVTLPGAAPCTADEPILLRWRLEQGSAWQLRVSQTIRTQATRGDRQEAVSLETAMELRWVVEEVAADETMRIGQTYTRFQLRSTTPDAEPVTYDSASADPPPTALQPIARVMRPLVGLRHELVLSPRGEILEVSRPPEADSLLGDLPSTSRWKQMLSKDGMDRVLRQSLGVLPASLAGVGDRWTSTRSIESSLGPRLLQTTYRLEGPTHRGQQVWQQIRARTDAAVPADDAADDTTTDAGVDLQAEQQAVYYFDAAAGYLAESHLLHTIRSEVPYGDASIGVQSTGRVTLRISPLVAE
jgi:hypothetical protein